MCSNLYDDGQSGRLRVGIVYSPKDRKGMEYQYWQFMERTRYLHRGIYVFTDRLVAPLIFVNIGSHKSLDVRIMTSIVWHHTVIARPMVAWSHEGGILNQAEICADINRVITLARLLTPGDLAMVRLDLMETQYKPVGYVLASEKDKENCDVRQTGRAGTARSPASDPGYIPTFHGGFWYQERGLIK